LDRELIRAGEEVAVKKLEGFVTVRKREIAATLDEASAVWRKENILRFIVLKNIWRVDNEGASGVFLRVVERDHTPRKGREAKLFSTGEVSLLEADDVTFREEVSNCASNKILAEDTVGVSGVVRKAVDIVRDNTWDQSTGVGKRGGPRELGNGANNIYKRRLYEFSRGLTILVLTLVTNPVVFARVRSLGVARRRGQALGSAIHVSGRVCLFTDGFTSKTSGG
jgi:hypothetical protein